MVDISIETPEQTETRLRRVIGAAELKVFDGTYAYSEFALAAFPQAVSPEALALVRDDELWSQLVPHEKHMGQAFTLFRFHFLDGLDNSGFVGWLATHLKRRFGTGLFVVCGQNTRHGGIFDYWGCPAELADLVINEVSHLRRP